jgi:hypothetical protein
MDFTREVVVPAALSEILGRIFAFLFDSLPRPSRGARELHRRRLERLLGNIASMVEEAEGRHITNQQLLSHLKALTAGMYRGRFTLEVTDLDDVVSRNGDGDDEDAGDGDATTAAASSAGKRSFALCRSFSRAKRSRVTGLIAGGDGGTERLVAVAEELEGLTRDYMREFILLVQGYPRKVHRPVRTTLYMDRCVFGRHVEKERVVDFLLQHAPSGRAPYLSALAVVGAKKVGKTTLVKHACDDERVRGHFVRIEWFETPDVVRAGGLPGQYLWESGGPEYLAGVRHILSEPRFANAAGPSLLVFEDAWPMDESAWAALASSPTPLGDGSKLLLTCRDADLARLGTADPVVLHRLQREEYWYYFKAFAFGGADPRDHPRVAAVAREISEHLERTVLDARVLGTLLRANFDARFWRRVLAAIVSCERRPMHVGVLLELLPVRGRLQSYGYCRSPPKFTVQDVLTARPSGRDGGSGSGSEEGFTVHLCKETLYMDHWYSITFKNDGEATPPVVTT